jgi:hypothetical protein
MPGGALLGKLSYCLGLSRLGESNRRDIIEPIANVLPTADPEKAFGWIGSLFTNTQSSAPASGTVVATITAPDDCFYRIDAVAAFVPGTPASRQRIFLEIVDPASAIQWQLGFSFNLSSTPGTSPGVFTPPIQVHPVFCHLLGKSIVRWRTVDVPATGSAWDTSISLMMLYQDIQ